MKKIYIPILNIIVAEMMLFFGQVHDSIAIHIINLLIIIFLIIFDELEIKMKYVLQSLILVILLRVINLSMPQFFTIPLLQYSLIYGIMFIPIYSIIKNQQISVEELGINFKKLHIYIPLAILIGTVIGILEHKILNPISLIGKIGPSDIILMVIVMFVFVGTVEEIIFRGILQTRFEKAFGIKYGILLSGGLFGVMHAGYGTLNEIIFVGIVGIVLGYIFYKTRSIPFVILIHGVMDMILFGVLSMVGW